MSELPVEQRHRDAAASLLGYSNWDDATDYRLSGVDAFERDEGAQAFARFERDNNLVPAPQWLPIETAPKDGTWIMAVVAGIHHDGKPYVPAVVQWDEFFSWVKEEYDDGRGWWLTHWMPLPAPPNMEASHGD